MLVDTRISFLCCGSTPEACIKDYRKSVFVRPMRNSVKKEKEVIGRVNHDVFHITKGMNKTHPEPEVVDDPDLNVSPKKNSGDDLGVHELWNNFRDNTTMHGLKNANLKQRHRLRCGIWAVALLAMGSCLFFTTYKQFTSYLQYTTITNTYMKTQSTINFPAITLCSVSTLKKKSLPDINHLEYFFLTKSIIGWMIPPLDLSKPDYTAYHMPLNTSWVQETANQVEDIFLFCLFEGEDKRCKKIMKPTVTKLGVCYTFNSRDHVQENGHMVTSRTGSTSGLRLYLMVNQSNYVYSNIMAAGIKVVIHDQNEEPDVVDKGFMISPGFSTLASIHKTDYRYLASPYKANRKEYCMNTKYPGYTNPLTDYDVYSQSACKMECKQNHVVRICGCRSPYDKGNYTTCSIAQLSSCYGLESERFDKNTTLQNLCACPIECEYSDYYARVSMGYFPAINYQYVFNQMGINNLRKTYLELAVYFESLGVLTVEQVPEYSFGDIVGILGGQMGIFLGASLLTLTELMEFALLSVFVLGKRFYKSLQDRRK